MKIQELNIKGVFEITLEAKEDHRGVFMRTYDDKVLAEHSINKTWVQEYQSVSTKKGTIRGLHFQLPPHTETKLVRAVQGEVLDVFVDLRKNSPTFGQWGSVVLSQENKKMIYIPRGFAHGICSLTNNTTIICKSDNHYTANSEYQIAWNDVELDISWPIESPIISEKDSKAKSFKEFVATVGGIESK